MAELGLVSHYATVALRLRSTAQTFEDIRGEEQFDLDADGNVVWAPAKKGDTRAASAAVADLSVVLRLPSLPPSSPPPPSPPPLLLPPTLFPHPPI